MLNSQWFLLQLPAAVSQQERHWVNIMASCCHAPPIKTEIPPQSLHGVKLRLNLIFQPNLDPPHLFRSSSQKGRLRTTMQTKRHRGGRRSPELRDSFVNQATMPFRLNLSRVIFAMTPTISIFIQFAPCNSLITPALGQPSS